MLHIFFHLQYKMAIQKFTSCDMYFLKDFIYLFLETGEGKEKERERNVSVWLPLIHLPPHWGPGPQPKHVP